METATSLVLDFIRAEDAGDRYAFRLGAQEYVLRGAGGGVENVELQWNSALLADLAALHEPGCDPAVVQRVGGALRRFLKSDEWARQEARLMDAVAHEQPVVVTIGSAAAELYALPWELLTLGASGQHLGELPSVLVRYEWPETQTVAESPSPRPEGGRVLFAWSSAGGPVPAAEHLRAIQEGAAEGHHSFDPQGDVLERVNYGRLEDVLKAAKAPGGKPISVLHLLCHGGAAGHTCGLVLDGEYAGEPAITDAGRLRQLLAPYAGMVRLVVIAACNSGNIGMLGNQLGSIAQALHQVGLAAVIASRFPLSIPGSNRFSETFYRELFSGPSSVETAFLAARRQLARDTHRLDWASMQLYARDADGRDSRPIVLRPYRGLLAFEPRHSRFFVGRGKLRAELKQRVLEAGEGKRPRFQVVAGASGSGKSSLLMAGVAPTLPSESWAYRVMRPGETAVLSEVERLSTEHPQGKFLLMVDQFEEVFTHLTPREREQQIQRLWGLAMKEHSNLVLIATLRVDFLDRCGEVGLGGGLRLDTIVYDEARRLFVPQLEPGEYPEIITEPAHRVGLEFDEGLVERIVADLGEEPGALPLLQYALDLLWQQRSGGRLTHEAYERITRAGGIAGALTATMDALYEGLSPEEQAQARRVLVSLVDFREDSSPYTRRRVELAAVRPSSEEAQRTFDSVVERLVQSRFLVRGSAEVSPEKPGAVTLEVAHEALIRRWERLNQWIHEDREKELQLRQLQGWTHEWTTHQKDPSYLLRGTRLGYALNIRERYVQEFPEETTRFIEESQRQDERRRRAARLRVLLTVGLTAIAALVMTSLYSNAEQQRKRARNMAVTATAQGLVNTDPTVGVALLKQVETPRVNTWTGSAIDSLLRPVAETVLKGHQAAVTHVVFKPEPTQSNPELTQVLTVSGKTVRLWNANGRGDPVVFQEHSKDITAVDFSPDGNRIIAYGGGVVHVWDVKTPNHSIRLEDHPIEIVAATLNATGREVITVGRYGAIQIWVLTEGGVTRGRELIPKLRRVTRATFNDARTLACVIYEDGAARIWRLDGQGESLVREMMTPNPLRDPISKAAVSLDGRIVATETDVNAQLWAMDSLKGPPFKERTFFLSGTASLRKEKQLALSRDGRRALLMGINGTYIWTADGQEEPIFVAGDADTADFSPDGNWVLIGHIDGSTRLRSLDSSPREHLLRGGCVRVRVVAFNHDSRRAALGCDDGTARIWSISPQDEPLSLQGTIFGVEFSPGARYVLTTASSREGGGLYRLWSVNEDGRLSELRELGDLWRYVFSPDGERILVIREDGSSRVARIESMDGKEEPVTLDSPGLIANAAFNPRNKGVIATLSVGGAVNVLQIGRTAKTLRTLQGNPREDGRKYDWGVIQISPDGERILVYLGTDIVRIMSIDGETVRDLDHDGKVLSAEFSPAGDYVLTVADKSNITQSRLKEARLWHANGTLAYSFSKEVVRASFSKDGSRVLGFAFERFYVWNTESGDIWWEQGAPAAPFEQAFFGPEDHHKVPTVFSVSKDGARLWRLEAANEPIVLSDGSRSEIREAALSSDGRFALTVNRESEMRSWVLSEDLLDRRLWQASTLCLSTRQRQRYLDETEQDAKRRCGQCEARYGRSEDNCKLD